jgi:hypothetical protein
MKPFASPTGIQTGTLMLFTFSNKKFLFGKADGFSWNSDAVLFSTKILFGKAASANI